MYIRAFVCMFVCSFDRSIDLSFARPFNQSTIRLFKYKHLLKQHETHSTQKYIYDHLIVNNKDREYASFLMAAC